jgi:hypothetical protein
MDAWHLSNTYTKAYGTFHATTLYFYPFIISQRHHLPTWLSGAIVFAWVALVATLACVLYQIRKQAQLGWKTSAKVSLTHHAPPKVSTVFGQSQEQV